MSSWLQRLRGTRGAEPDENAGQQRETTPVQRSRAQRSHSQKPVPKDPNVPVKRLQLHQKCLYERMLPGNAYISAHVNRLQHGFYESTALHEPNMDNVYFVSVHFVFHPHDPRSHRFKSADIRVSIHGDFNPSTDSENGWYRSSESSPRILKHAPELMYGAVSPETLQWNFSLSSSLGVSQAPLSATLNPSGGVKSSYKLYDMMSIQGSLRSLKSPLGPQYDVEDAMAVWTLEENLLQRSGLPREFDFVLLVYKPDNVKNVYLSVDVDADVETWFGQYPQWWTNLSRYLPTQDFTIDFNTDIGQRFRPIHSAKGFNFADLPHPLEEYVTMPGTIYPTSDGSTDGRAAQHRRKTSDQSPDDRKTFQFTPTTRKALEASPTTLEEPFTPTRRHPASSQYQPSHRQSWAAPDTLNVRVMLEHSGPSSPSARRYSSSPLSNQDPTRQHSIRRKRSRSGLKDYSAQQALHEIARETLKDNGDSIRRRSHGDGVGTARGSETGPNGHA